MALGCCLSALGPPGDEAQALEPSPREHAARLRENQTRFPPVSERYSECPNSSRIKMRSPWALPLLRSLFAFSCAFLVREDALRPGDRNFA